ncbi:hypothetical protein FOA52_004549 [Chlamydomonas sp. UWO 241]|nr:hypothetical protein FOA52_004549 [Chlamydomonas sp. UWO 241]
MKIMERSLARQHPAATPRVHRWGIEFSRNTDSDTDAKLALLSRARHVPPPTVRQLAEP